MGQHGDGVYVVATSDRPIEGKADLSQLMRSLRNGADAIWQDIKVTNQHTAGKAMKFAGGMAVGGKVAAELGAVTPLKWALSGFGPLPAEFTKSGAIQVFRYTGMERLRLVAGAAGAKFVLVTLAYEGGVVVGSAINQTLSEEIKDAIGGTINEIVNEGGWKLLFTHPFGIGM